MIVKFFDWMTRPPVVFYAGLLMASAGASWGIHPAAGVALFGVAIAYDAQRPPRGNGQ